MAQSKYKILILTSDAGFGHRSAAIALKDAIDLSHGDTCQTTIINPLDHSKTPRLLKESQNDYDAVVKKLPELYKMGYKASDSTIPTALMEGGLIVLLFEAFQEIITQHQPDLVITTYPIYQAPLDAINQLGVLKFPWITTITDLVTVHRLWLHTGARICMVPTKTVEQRAIKSGLKPEQIMMSGIPVNPRIHELQSVKKQTLRKEFGWDQDKTAILLVGGTRVTTLINALKVIDHSGFDLQLILVAGGDDQLHQNFQNIDWHHPAKIYDFVEDMPGFMRAADMIVCKAGGLIVTEALASGLPLMLSQALPGQEIGNADFVIENQAGCLCETPIDTLQTLSHWMINDQTGLKKTAQNAKNLGRPEAAHFIADSVWDVLQEKSEDKQTGQEKHNTFLEDLMSKFKIPWAKGS